MSIMSKKVIDLNFSGNLFWNFEIQWNIFCKFTHTLPLFMEEARHSKLQSKTKKIFHFD